MVIIASKRFSFLWMIAVSVVSVGVTNAFLRVQATTSYRTRLFVATELPLEQYKKTISVLETALEEASVLAAEIQALSSRLQSIESTDPDIRSPSDAASSYYSSSSSSRLLYEAVAKAVACADGMGRSSLETSLAWLRVDALLQREPVRSVTAALLSHPSYRYSYATNVILRQGLPLTATNNNTRDLPLASARHLQSVEHMRARVAIEKHRLDELDRGRAILLNRWTNL
jgi:hypothetical protein